MRRRLSNWLPLLLLAAARADDDDDACSGTYTLSGQGIRLKTAPLGAASPYALASQPDGECARPGDALVRVGAANVFDGTLQDAVEAWGAGRLTDEVAFPLADDGNVRGYALVRFVGAEQELAFRRGAGGAVEEDDAADDDLEAEAAALRAEARQRALAAEAERAKARAEEDAAEKAAVEAHAAKVAALRAAERQARDEKQAEARRKELERIEAEEAERARKAEEERKERDEARLEQERRREAEIQQLEKQKKAREKEERRLKRLAEAEAEAAKVWENRLVKYEAWAETAWAAQKRDAAARFEFLPLEFAEAKGPLGMTFGAGKSVDATLVTHVDAGKRAARAGVLRGDEVVELRWLPRDDDGARKEVVVNTTVVRPERVTAHVMEAIKKRWWPLTFVVFRAHEVGGVEAEAPLFVSVAAPVVLRGDQGAVTVAPWAATPVREDVDLVLADPLDGCAGSLLAEPAPVEDGRVKLGAPPPSDRKRFALAKRGGCSFVDKARALQAHVDGVLIYNTEADPVKMPAGGVPTDDISVVVAMVGADQGQRLERALRWPDRDAVALALADTMPSSDAPHHPDRDFDDEDAPPVTGNVTFQCGRDVVEARFRSAAFGPLLAPHAPLGVGFAVPPSLCALSGVERRLAGLAAVAQRGGGCGFQEKARVAEKLQAAALVVVNSEDSLTTMTLPDPDARASVAALMVGASAGAALEAMAAGACGRAAGVLARLAYDAPELGDEDDG